jgi:flagellar basal body-associated protein FliL
MIGLEWIIAIVLLVIFLIVGSITAFIIISRIKWPYRWELYEEIAPNHLSRTKIGRAKLVNFGDGGEEMFYLKGLNKYKAAYGHRVGKNLIAWARGSDGYWYNFTLQGINKKLLEVGVFPVDRDMRMANATIRKQIDTRYENKSFMDKYGTLITFGMLFICILAMGGFLWVAFDKLAESTANNAEAAKASIEVMELAGKVLSNVDTIKSGGSGFIQSG